MATKFRVHLKGYSVSSVDVTADSATKATASVMKRIKDEGVKGVVHKKTKIVKENTNA